MLPVSSKQSLWLPPYLAWLLWLLVGILLFCESAWLVWLAPTDLRVYQCYALTFWQGSGATRLLAAGQCAFLQSHPALTAGHMLPIEYPPLTLVPFSLPLLVPLPYYTLTFALGMALVALSLYWLMARQASRDSAQLLALYLVVGACATLQLRYDLLPAALTLICISAAARGRWRLAYVALALGTLLKLYPLVLLPALVTAEQQARGRLALTVRSEGRSLARQLWESLRGLPRWHWEHVGLFVAVLLFVTGLFALLNFQEGVVSPLSYFVGRPVQIEALQGTLLWLGNLFGAPWRVLFTYGSLNVESSLSALTTPLGPALFGAGALLVLWRQWRGQLDLPRAALLLLLLLIATGKVFSPQYLLWLIPLLAYCGPTDARWWRLSWVGLLALTSFMYIFYYSLMPDPQSAPQVVQSLPGFFELIGVRNLGFVGLTLAYLFNWFDARSPAKPVGSAIL